MITEAYIELGEYRHALVIYADDGWRLHMNIHDTGVKPPPINTSTLKGRQQLWVLSKISGVKDIGEFPRA